MKPVYINFVHGRVHWWIWSAALVACVFAFCFFLVEKIELMQQDDLLVKQILELQKELSQKERNSVKIEPQPKANELKIVHGILRQDINKIFNVVESEFDKEIYLKALSFDIISGEVSLEYEVDSLEGVVGVANALNAGYEERPWKLESVAELKESRSFGAGGKIRTFKSLWRAHLGGL